MIGVAGAAQRVAVVLEVAAGWCAAIGLGGYGRAKHLDNRDPRP